MNLLMIVLSVIAQAREPMDIDPSRGFGAVLTFPRPAIVEIESGAFPEFEGVPTRFVPGEPPRPALTLFIPVPPGADPVLSFQAGGYRSTGAASSTVRTPDVVGEGLDAELVRVERSPPPDRHAVLEGVIPVAGTRVAVVTVYPVTDWNGSSYASSISVNLDWAPAPGGHSADSHPLLGLVVPEGCLYWKTGTDQTYQSVFWGLPWARISIQGTGGYSVTGSQLEASGCQVTGTPCSTIRMFTGPGVMFSSEPESQHSLEEISVTIVDDDGDGIFDDEDSVRFFGRGLSRWHLNGIEVERLQHRYATRNVYWLTWGGEDGRRIGAVAGEPDASPQWGTTIRSDLWLRQENIWMPRYETGTGWAWQSISEGEALQVPFQVADAGQCGLDVSMIAESSQIHTVSLWVNGSEVLSDSWYGSGARTLEVDGLLLSGSNELEIRFEEDAGGGDLALVSVHVEYPGRPDELTGMQLFPSRERTGRFNFSIQGVSSGCTAYDLSDHYAPMAVTGGEYTGENYEFSFQVDSSTVLMLMDGDDWTSPDSISPAGPGRLVGTVDQGDRLIVVHPSMYDGIWGIEEALSMQGLVPVVATTSEIYDEFGQGVADPGAIRSAVRWAMDTWSPGLAGLILAGDGHYDFLGRSTSQPVMIPPWIVLGTTREDCVDDLYVMVHQGAQLPEIPVSRIPADNLSQLGTCTAKLFAYLQGGSIGDWTGRVLMVADDEWGKPGNWNETEHTVNTELIAEEVLPRWVSRDKFYLVEFPWPPGPWTPEGPHPEKPEARESFLETLDRGHLLMIYQGHGAANQIAHEVLMLDQDVSGLDNGYRLPVAFWATCDVGHFDDPGTDAIGESMVIHPAGGSISGVAATRGTYGTSNYQYFRSVTDSLFSVPGLSVGEAVWQSKLALSGSYAGNNRFYVMFGYPDLPLPVPGTGGEITVSGDTLRSGEMNTVSGEGFQNEGLAFVEILESSWNTVYTCLGGAQIPYVKYGGAAYRGTQNVENGAFTLDCFIPLQSRTGDMARSGSFAIAEDQSTAGADDPAHLTEGTPSGGDLQGPEVEMWIRGYEGVEVPQLTGDVTLEAQLTDSSGICVLGGPGKELSLFVDGSGSDVGRYFSYDRGSSVSGSLQYGIESLTEGMHTLILWSVDGLGNSSRDTLEIRILQERDLAITEALVYPNPGSGSRCFSFRVSEDAQVSVSIFTVAGTRIEDLTAVCTQGYNQIMWNGLDHDGDPVATGPYIYKIRAEALGTSVFSRTAEEYGIVAVIREE